ncbi:MAG TPA: peptidase U32 family protein [Nitrospiria bacterium]|nr:peptidase U32 family protein [Nitrospiria bacterium]
MTKRAQICSPAGNLASLIAAADSGADAIYIGFNDTSNLRNFPGLNFTSKEMKEGIDYVHKRGKKVYLTINSYPQHKELETCFKAIDNAVSLKADAVILSDLALLSYAKEKHPNMDIHLSVQASASNSLSIEFYKAHFGVKRVILPRVLSLYEIREIKRKTDVELEIFVFGLLCINCEGQCFLSSYLTGESINTYGACSPPRFVRFEEGEAGFLVRSNGVLLNCFKEGEAASYPTPCKGRYMDESTGEISYIIQEPESLNLLEVLPDLLLAGVDALKIEGRQRSKAYVSEVTAIFRTMVDRYYEGDRGVSPDTREIEKRTGKFLEGLRSSKGCYLGK